MYEAMDVTLARRYAAASSDTRRLVDRLLEQDAADQAWARHIGPALGQQEVAELLGKSKQAVSADRRLLALRGRSGRVVYPVFQFDGRELVRGLNEVVPLLVAAAASAWTVASWLSSPSRMLDGRRPIEALHGDEFDEVFEAATAFAHDLTV